MRRKERRGGRMATRARANISGKLVLKNEAAGDGSFSPAAGRGRKTPFLFFLKTRRPGTRRPKGNVYKCLQHGRAKRSVSRKSALLHRRGFCDLRGGAEQIGTCRANQTHGRRARRTGSPNLLASCSCSTSEIVEKYKGEMIKEEVRMFLSLRAAVLQTNAGLRPGGPPPLGAGMGISARRFASRP